MREATILPADRANHMKSQDVVSQLRRLKREADEVIGELRESNIGKYHVNWLRVKTMTAERCVDEDGLEYSRVWVINASPDDRDFRKEIEDRLKLRGFDVEVQTEW